MKYHSDQKAEIELVWVLICSGRVADYPNIHFTGVKKNGAHKTLGSPEGRFQKSSLFRFKWSVMVDVICMCIREQHMFSRLTTFNELVCRQEVTEETFSRSLPSHRTITLGSPVLHFFHPTIPPSPTSKGDRMDFVFWDVAIRDEPHPPPIHLKLQPQRWRGCRVINIFDASDIFSDVLLWSMSSFPSYFSISSVCHPWDRGCVIAPEADAGWRVKFSWGGDRWGAKAPTLNILLRIDVSTQLHYTDCTDEAFSLWMRYLPAQDTLGGKLRHMTEHLKLKNL